ncbi:hypothetical protein ACFY05_32865 [Microtetraspora fusca]|uniref:Uncharacterized protein n=1 Tax=Microtetraspora fusca TaxID=1997 RepID=A0ABW6VET9_MICFU
MKTIAVDFDRVLHSYERGWHDGTIYGTLVPGADEALRTLMAKHAVYVLTTRRPLGDVARWICWATGIPTAVMSDTPEREPWPYVVQRRRFWDVPHILLVTDRKLPFVALIDDRAIPFTGCWPQALAALNDLIARKDTAMTDPAQRLARIAALCDDTDLTAEQKVEAIQAAVTGLADLEHRAPRSAGDLETK